MNLFRSHLPLHMHMCCQVASVVSDSVRPHGLQPTRLLPWDVPDKSTGVGHHFLLQRIFPTQGLNLGLLQYRRILYHLSHQESSRIPLGAPKDSKSFNQNPKQVQRVMGMTTYTQFRDCFLFSLPLSQQTRVQRIHTRYGFN